MAQKTANMLLHCDSCGEDYSSTYRRCPFCGSKGGKPKEVVPVEDEYVFDGGYIFDEIDREASEKVSREPAGAGTFRSGGKRLSGGVSAAQNTEGSSESPRTSSRSGASSTNKKAQHPDVRTSGARSRTSHSRLDALDAFLERNDLTLPRLIGLAFSLVVIIAAFIILFTVVIPMFSGDSGNDSTAGNSGTSQTDNPAPTGSADLPATGSPTSDPTPSPTGSTIPADQTATDFILSTTEFAISDRWPQPVTIKVTFIPANSKGTVTWSSSNENIATVDQNGTVSAVSKGSATITATLTGGVSHTCKVYVNISDTATTSPDPSGSVSPEPDPSPSATTSPQPSAPVESPLTLSKTEFTISEQWPQPVTLKVSNASGDVVWSTSDPAVAIVDSNGKVTALSRGKCVITVTDAAGNTAECTVRCTFTS